MRELELNECLKSEVCTAASPTTYCRAATTLACKLIVDKSVIIDPTGLTSDCVDLS